MRTSPCPCGINALKTWLRQRSAAEPPARPSHNEKEDEAGAREGQVHLRILPAHLLTGPACGAAESVRLLRQLLCRRLEIRRLVHVLQHLVDVTFHDVLDLIDLDCTARQSVARLRGARSIRAARACTVVAKERCSPNVCQVLLVGPHPHGQE
eukprot:CAMPEP_0206164404 /NCGR_PEP_ID=MMETSP1474-20131121/16148_1 /ASSEMBLY_ACC=CAM_ASM_001110 /TAXON_ID=97495 /ORGANISM="Imantonia sp., Strain RCC918" /LENGTH=152 /DNA_ID=CAMNT_0053567263 /DNA_START=380 /DNA_END=835 /DNA_ORIENTATION=+